MFRKIIYKGQLYQHPGGTLVPQIGAKHLLDFVAKIGIRRQALSPNHEADYEGLTDHFCNILNVRQQVNPSVLSNAPDFTDISHHADFDWILIYSPGDRFPTRATRTRAGTC